MQIIGWRFSLCAVLVAGLGAALACQSTSKSTPSCAPICTGVDDCAGTSCLAYCLGLETACTATGHDSAFSDWASCGPALACTEGAFVAASCQVQLIGTLACGDRTAPSSGTSTGASVGPTSGTASYSGASNTATETGTLTGPGSQTATHSGRSTTGSLQSSESSACAAIGATCAGSAACCSLYCKAGVCACNTAGYACGQPDDCCEGFVCNSEVCVGDAQTVVTCKDCSGDAGACPAKTHCEGLAAGGSYCAQDCTTNQSACALDATCMADTIGGFAFCYPNSGQCVTGDAG